MRKAIAMGMLALLFGLGIPAAPHHQSHLQAVTGIASTADAQRHYLLHVANFVSPTSTDPISINAIAFKAWFISAIAAFNAVQETRTDAKDEANAMAAFIAERDSQVSYYMGQATAGLTPQEKHAIYVYIEKTKRTMVSGVEETTEAERKSNAHLGGGQTQYGCAVQPEFPTCSATYSSSYNITSYFGPGKTDDFQRANGGLGSNWTTLTGSFAIAGDYAEATAAGQVSVAYYNAYQPTADQSSTIELQSMPQTSPASYSADVRMGTTGGASANRYEAIAAYRSGADIIYLWEWNGGTQTELGSWAPPGAFAVGDTITMMARGSLLSVFYNGQKIIETVNSDIASGYTGMEAYASPTAQISAWSGNSDGDITTFNNILDGQGTMQSGHGTPTHTPLVSNEAYGVESYVNGTGVCASCYFYADGSFPVAFQPGAPVNINNSGTLTCSVAGLFFSIPASFFLSETATTYVNTGASGNQVYKGPNGNYYQWYLPVNPYSGKGPNGYWQNLSGPPTTYGYYYNVANACAAGTTTPDANFNAVGSSPAFQVMLPAMYLTGGTWNGNTVPQQGYTILTQTKLFRWTSSSDWFVSLSNLFAESNPAPSGTDPNIFWNNPTFKMEPLLGSTKLTGPCTQTSTTTNYSVQIQNQGFCIGYLASYGNGYTGLCSVF